VHTLTGHRGAVYSAAFSPDGAQIVTASWDKTAKIWQCIPAHDFDQALFIHMLDWAKRNNPPAAWNTEWANDVMNSYELADQALIEKAFPNINVANNNNNNNNGGQ